MSEALLQVSELRAGYGRVEVLRGVTLDVLPGEIVALLGSNGAGKSTLNNTVCALLPAWDGEVRFGGEVLTRAHSRRVVQAGLIQVPEGRRIFPSLSVEENLLVGAYRGRPGGWTLARVYDLFPVLAERRRQPGTNLSGGEQQMLAIGRGLMGNPRLLLVDEVSLGLAPVVVRGLYRVLRMIAQEGTTTLVVDQDVSQIMELAQRVYCFRKGTVSLEGRPADLTRARIAAAYFGM